MALSLSHVLGLLLGVGFGLLGVLEGVNVPFCLRSAMQSKRRGERLVSLFNLQNDRGLTNQAQGKTFPVFLDPGASKEGQGARLKLLGARVARGDLEGTS